MQPTIQIEKRGRGRPRKYAPGQAPPSQHAAPRVPVNLPLRPARKLEILKRLLQVQQPVEMPIQNTVATEAAYDIAIQVLAKQQGSVVAQEVQAQLAAAAKSEVAGAANGATWSRTSDQVSDRASWGLFRPFIGVC